MPDDNNELNDIILNGKKEKNRTNKRILIGIGSMALLLIVLVTAMGRFMHLDEDQLPALSAASQSSIVSTPSKTDDIVKEALVEINQESTSSSSKIDEITEKIAKKLKEENLSDTADEKVTAIDKKVQEDNDIVIIDSIPEETTMTTDKTTSDKPKSVKQIQKVNPKKMTSKTVNKGHTPTQGDVYIQVGAFSKYKPESGFLNKITSAGYDYTYYRIVKNGSIYNKVLVGPFLNQSDARKNLKTIRKAIEPGAFLYTIEK